MFFPHWVWMGRQLRKFKLPFTDSLFFRFPACFPVLSTFYPAHFVTAFLGSFLKLDYSFILLQFSILAHFILGSVLSYFMFLRWATPEVALLGSVVLTYNGYCIKVQQPTIAYTLAWIPGMFVGGIISVISTTMAILSGYYPILIYILPFALFFNLAEVTVGALFGLIQLIPFLIYYSKSVRFGKKFDGSIGRVPIFKFTDLFLFNGNRTHTNGVFFMEMGMYVGVIPLLLIWNSTSKTWIMLMLGIAITTGLIRQVQRIPARALYLVVFSITWLMCDSLNGNFGKYQLIALTLIQAWCLLRNNSTYPSFPFTEWWNKPSDKVHDITGYLTGKSNGFYDGSFALRSN